MWHQTKQVNMDSLLSDVNRLQISVLEIVHWRYGATQNPLWYQSYNQVILYFLFLSFFTVTRVTAGTAVFWTAVYWPIIKYDLLLWKMIRYCLGFLHIFHTQSLIDLWCMEIAMLYIERVDDVTLRCKPNHFPWKLQ